MRKRWRQIWNLGALLLAIPCGAPASQLSEGTLARGHSHNDYERKAPLHEALDHSFASIEVDIWHRDNDLWISHTGLPWDWKGTLRTAYLEPLQSIVDKRGSVHGNGKPFYLWLDLKGGGDALRAELHRQLARYPMFAEAVQVILTGDDETKRKFTEEGGPVRVWRDSNSVTASDPPADSRWRWYALNWSEHVAWNGDGAAPARVRAKLVALCRSIHANGRWVRFYDVPETRAAWKLLLESDADQISTDHPDDYLKFAQSLPEETSELRMLAIKLSTEHLIVARQPSSQP